MRLSDIMSNMNLVEWAEIALVLFLAIFAGVVLYLFVFSKKEKMDQMARLPLDDSDVNGANRPRLNNAGGADE